MTAPDPHAPTRPVEAGPLHEAGTAPHSAPGSPVDHSREAPAVAALRRRGFTSDFLVQGDTLRVAGTDRHLRPEDVRIVDYYRFEGTSDPDDMSVIYALEARDGTRGTLTDAFGSYADPAIGAVLDRMGIEPRQGRLRWRHVMIPVALGGAAAYGLVMLARRLRAA
jgi:hypothetical protein